MSELLGEMSVLTPAVKAAVILLLVLGPVAFGLWCIPVKEDKEPTNGS